MRHTVCHPDLSMSLNKFRRIAEHGRSTGLQTFMAIAASRGFEIHKRDSLGVAMNNLLFACAYTHAIAGETFVKCRALHHVRGTDNILRFLFKERGNSAEKSPTCFRFHFYKPFPTLTPMSSSSRRYDLFLCFCPFLSV